MATLGSDTRKYLTQCVAHTTKEMVDLVSAHERFKAAQAIETMRKDALKVVTMLRFTLIKQGVAPHSTTIRLGEIAKAMTRAGSVKEMTDLMEEFHRVGRPYQPAKS